MNVFESIERIGQIAERARARRAQSVPLSAEYLREKKRHIIGYLCSWGTLCPGSGADGSPVWNSFVRGCFADQLERRPSVDHSIRFVVFHDNLLDIGFWGPLSDELHGLRGLAVPKDSPATFELIEAINDGRSSHLSLHADVVRSRERQKLGPGGWPIHDILEARITEAGPCPAGLAKDAGAMILSVGGVEPQWYAEDRRFATLRGLRPVPPLTG